MANEGSLLLRSAVVMVQTETTTNTDPGSWSAATHSFVTLEPPEFNAIGNSSPQDIAPVAGQNMGGTSDTINGFYWSTLSIKVPLMGTGSNASAAALLPDWEPLVKACSMEVETDATPYRRYRTKLGATKTCHFKMIVGPSPEAAHATLKWKEYRMGGCAGTIKLVGGDDGQAAAIEMEFQGTFNDPIDAADPGDPTLSTEEAEPFDNIGTTWDSHAPIVKSWEVDFGNNIVPRKNLNKAGGVEGFMITQQVPVCSMQVEEELAAARDYHADWKARTKAVLETGPIGTAGNRWRFNAGRAQLTGLSHTDADELAALDCQWKCHQDISSLSTPAAYFQLD